MEIKRGEMYWIRSRGAFGCEQKGDRPCLILQNDIGNKHSTTTIIAQISGSARRHFPTHVEVFGFGLTKTSSIMLEQIKTVDKGVLGDFIGALDEETMKKVENAIKISLGLED